MSRRRSRTSSCSTPAPTCPPRSPRSASCWTHARHESPAAASATRSTSSPTCSGPPGRRTSTRRPLAEFRRQTRRAGPGGRAGGDRPGPAGRVREPGRDRRHRAAGRRSGGHRGPHRRGRSRAEELRPHAARGAAGRTAGRRPPHGQQKTVDLPAGGTAAVRFRYRFETPGDHAVEVRAERRRAGRRQPSLPGRSRAAGDPGAVHRRPAVGRAVPGRGRLSGRGLGPQGDGGRAAAGRRRGGRRKRDPGTRPGRLRLRVPGRTWPSSPPAKPACWTPTWATAAAWCSSSASRCRPTATTASLAAGRRAARILPARLGAVVAQPQAGLDPLGYRHPIVAGVSRPRARRAC